jgi:molecular chaperone GrpE
MTEHDHDRGAPKVKFTDKRRVRMDDAVVEGEQAGGPGVGGGSSASGSESTQRSDPRGDGPTGPDPREAGAGEAAGSELEQAQRQAAEYLEHLQRLQAEFANFRKRVLKEQTRAVELASEPLMRRVLEVLDEFDLALMAAEQKPEFDKFLHGVELVYAKLKDILAAEGLERIPAEGAPFDPERHEALMQSGSGEGEPVVGDVLRQGYTLRGRVIRPSGVKVVRK